MYESLRSIWRLATIHDVPLYHPLRLQPESDRGPERHELADKISKLFLCTTDEAEGWRIRKPPSKTLALGSLGA